MGSRPVARRANHFVFSEMACPAPFAKIFPFAPDPNQFTESRRLVPHEGRIAIVTDAGRDAVDARASGAQWQSQGEMNLVSGQPACKMIGALADGEAVWFWHPLLV